MVNRLAPLTSGAFPWQVEILSLKKVYKFGAHQDWFPVPHGFEAYEDGVEDDLFSGIWYYLQQTTNMNLSMPNLTNGTCSLHSFRLTLILETPAFCVMSYQSLSNGYISERTSPNNVPWCLEIPLCFVKSDVLTCSVNAIPGLIILVVAEKDFDAWECQFDRIVIWWIWGKKISLQSA